MQLFCQSSECFKICLCPEKKHLSIDTCSQYKYWEIKCPYYEGNSTSWLRNRYESVGAVSPTVLHVNFLYR